MEKPGDNLRTVLIVDDDEDLLILIQHALTVEGFDPICSPNGVNITSIVTRKRPEIILLDFHLDGRDGAAICKELKQNPETALIPIIMFSADENVGAISQECGADSYILKPFSNEKFREIFMQVLSRRNDKKAIVSG